VAVAVVVALPLAVQVVAQPLAVQVVAQPVAVQVVAQRVRGTPATRVVKQDLPAQRPATRVAKQDLPPQRPATTRVVKQERQGPATGVVK